LVVSTFFTIAFPASNQYIPRNVEPCAITVHSIKMFDYRRGLSKADKTIGTTIIKAFANEIFIFLSVNPNLPIF
jgi:hypothetical protein